MEKFQRLFTILLLISTMLKMIVCSHHYFLGFSDKTGRLFRKELPESGQHPCLGKDPDSQFKSPYQHGWHLCTGKGSFTDQEWPRHQEDLLSTNISNEKIDALLYWLLDADTKRVCKSKVKDVDWEGILKTINKRKFKQRAQYITVSDINNLTKSTESQVKKAKCAKLGIIIGQLNNFENFGRLDSECLSSMLESSVSGKVNNNPFSVGEDGKLKVTYSVNDIYSKFENNYSLLHDNGHDEVIVDHMKRDDVRPYVPDSIVKMLFRTRPALCSKMNASLFKWIIESKDRATILSLECAKNLPESILKQSYGQVIRNIPDSFFQSFSSVDPHNDFMTFATEEQIVSWGMDNVKHACSNLNLLLLTETNIKGVSSICFLNAIKSDFHNLNLNNKWSAIRNDILSGLSEEDTYYIIQNIDGQNLEKMTNDQRQSLLEYPSKCKNIKEQVITEKSTIKKECFENMSPYLQSKVMAKCKQLSEDILSGVTSDKARSWVFGGKNGVNVLLFMKRFPKAIYNLSAEVDREDQSVCKLITLGQYMKDLKPIQSMLRPTCKFMIKTSGTNPSKFLESYGEL